MIVHGIIKIYGHFFTNLMVTAVFMLVVWTSNCHVTIA